MLVLKVKDQVLPNRRVKERNSLKHKLLLLLIVAVSLSIPQANLIGKFTWIDWVFTSVIGLLYVMLAFFLFLPSLRELSSEGYTEYTLTKKVMIASYCMLPVLLKYLVVLLFGNQIIVFALVVSTGSTILSVIGIIWFIIVYPDLVVCWVLKNLEHESN